MNEHLKDCRSWTGHSCDCWLRRHAEDLDDSPEAAMIINDAIWDDLEAENHTLKAALAAERIERLAWMGDCNELEAENTVASEDLEAAKRDLQMEREWRGKAESELADTQEDARLYNVARKEALAERDAAWAALAERDRMLQVAYEREDLPAEWAPDEYAMWVDVLCEQVKLQKESVVRGIPICSEVDEFTCYECSGHNRCEEEMDAGFGDYGRDDPREDR